MIQDFTQFSTYITIFAIIGITIFGFYFAYKKIKKNIFFILYSACLGVSLAAYVFKAEIACLLFFFIALIIYLLGVVFNVGAFRNAFSNANADKKGWQKSAYTETLYDRDEVISQVNAAVQYCSNLNKNKAYDKVNKKNEAGVGMLICFERKDRLDDIIDPGFEVLDANISSRLLLSIFFEGTSLHDGAVIIRGNKVYAASAFLPPTTDPIFGKFGARHRAAKGVTQKSDCVALLVSEETGEILIFDDGDGIVVPPEQFEVKFREIFDNPERFESNM